MALTSTVYTFDLDISDVDRGVYVTHTVSVARHPSETLSFMITRLLAFALEYRDNLEFTRGLSQSEEPALWAKDLTGALQAWIEVGNPSPERIHRARKACEYVTIYSTRDVRQLLEIYRKEKIYAAETISLFTIDTSVIDSLESLVARRTKLSISRNESVLYFDCGSSQFSGELVRYTLA